MILSERPFPTSSWSCWTAWKPQSSLRSRKAGTMGQISFKDELVAQIPGLRAFAVSLCGSVSLADDLVQEALLRAWSNSDKFQRGTSLRAWLFTILRNV